jgi:hypothetical protein
LAGKFAEALRAAASTSSGRHWRRRCAVTRRGCGALRRAWGESDCAIVATEPEFDGTYEIDLRCHVGEPDGSEQSIGPALTFALDRSPALRGQWGTTVEAFDDPPAI